MNTGWIHPKTITGDAATGERYLRRPHINEEFWREVGKGNHILFVAPRRVGKTSIMKDLAENAPDGYACIYQNIEGVKTRNEFYRRLFEIILQCIERSNFQKAKDLLGLWIKKYGVSEVTKSGVKFQEKEIDYENELRNMIPELVKTEVHTVIFLDEFAEVINKLKKQNLQDDAIAILHTMREIRSDEDFRKFTIVYAGSIGLQFVIKSLDRLKLINDLHAIDTGALSIEETRQLVHQITHEATINFTDDVTNYLAEKLGHLLPYYVQLMIEEANVLAMRANEPNITNDNIDAAFNGVLSKNRNFDDWLGRLKDYQGEQFPFINELLIICAHKDRITVQEIYNLALDNKYKRQDDYMDYVDELVNDGYIVAVERGVYRFISPFLQQFWTNKFPVYNG
jgi:uncharacterized protein